MATYKKRGYKPKTKVEQELEGDIENFENVEENSTTAEVFNTLDETASKTEDWVASNQKYIFVIIGVVAAVVLGYLGYNEFVAQPKESEAMNDMSQAKIYFNQAQTASGAERDSLYTLVLNGGEGKFGMLDIIENHGGTPASNIAEYYAGMAYLNLKDYSNAIEHLGDFSSDDEALAPVAKGAIGDAFVQLNQLDDALDYYKEAANLRTNEFTTPLYLNKAGLIALELGNADEALGYFKRIKNEFPSSTEATTIDVFIGKAEVLASK